MLCIALQLLLGNRFAVAASLRAFSEMTRGGTQSKSERSEGSNGAGTVWDLRGENAPHVGILPFSAVGAIHESPLPPNRLPVGLHHCATNRPSCHPEWSPAPRRSQGYALPLRGSTATARVILSGANAKRLRSRTFSTEIPNGTSYHSILAALGFRLRSG